MTVVIPKDKQDHAVYSLALALAGALVFDPSTGVALALAIGAVKEIIWDWLLKRGTPDWRDMAANCGGIAVAVILLAR